MAQETFNTSGTFRVPAGVTELSVECWGAGGRIGNGTAIDASGGAGGGAYASASVTVTPHALHDVIVGTPSDGLTGGDSRFDDGSQVLAAGGQGDDVIASGDPLLGGQAADSVGAVRFSGGDGGVRPTFGSGNGGGGGGGSATSVGDGGDGEDAVSFAGGLGGAGEGNGGHGGDSGDPGLDGAPPGGGAGGKGSDGAQPASEGGDGRVVITWTPFSVTGTGGAMVGGQADVEFQRFVQADVIGSGGVIAGGTATFAFENLNSVTADIVVEWDFDNDGDFDELEENITTYLVSGETFTGRDWPSLLTGKAGPGKAKFTFRNDDDRFNFFNQVSPLNQEPFSLRVGRKLRVRTAFVPPPPDTFEEDWEVADGSPPPPPWDESRVSYASEERLSIQTNGGEKVLRWSQHTSGWLEAVGTSFDEGTLTTRFNATSPTNGHKQVWFGLNMTFDNGSVVSGYVVEVYTTSLLEPFTARLLRYENGSSTVVDSDTFDSGDFAGIWVGVEFSILNGQVLFTMREEEGDENEVILSHGDSSALGAGSLALGGLTSGNRRFDVASVEFVTPTEEPPQRDAALLARDRFRRANGPLGDTETGQTWSQPLANEFIISGNEAVASSEGNEHIAVIDVNATDYYAQLKLAGPGRETTGRTGNTLGLVYRYQDTSNYSLAVLNVDAAELQIIDVVSGTPSTAVSETVEVYDNMTIGVELFGSTVTLYLEGVSLISTIALQTDETEVGIYAEWGTDSDVPELDDFYVWDGLPPQVEGVLWTGDVVELKTSVVPGLDKIATVEGEGRLARMANQKVMPPSTVDGRSTGTLVGSTLAMSNLLHPPGPIDEGVITTGPFGFDRLNAIEAVRRLEEVEFGFLYETQEGQIGFDSRTARDGSSSQVTFSDAHGVQFSYRIIEPFDWRREVINRVQAGVTSSTPIVESITERELGSSPNLSVEMPSTVNDGDLLLVFIAASAQEDGYDAWYQPPGWTDLTAGKTRESDDEDALGDDSRIYARRADGSEGGETFLFGADIFTGGRSIAVQIYRISNWFGSVQDGIARSDYAEGSDPTVVFTSGGREPTLFIAARSGLVGDSPSVSGTLYPVGYTDGRLTFPPTAAFRSALQSAHKLAISPGVENPGPFGGTFTGFARVDVVVVAVRGFDGDGGDGRVVQADDLDSQDEHNAIRTHRNSANLFASESDAESYANLVLDRYADDRPIFQLEFRATRNGAYRMQAVRRRLSDLITLVANGDTGMGVAQDFFIEAIGHKWSDGGFVWDTTWELSPAGGG